MDEAVFDEMERLIDQAEVARVEKASVLLGLIDLLIEKGVFSADELLTQTNARMGPMLEQLGKNFEGKEERMKEWSRRYGILG